MKQKFRTLLLVLGLMFISVLNVNAETTIKEDASTYTGDVYIIGSSKFDSSVIVTGTMATAAGAREMQIQYHVYGNYDFDPADIRIYYYSELDETWSVLPVTSDDEMTELTEKETEELTENLNIYFVNEIEKTLEIEYEIELEEGYELEYFTHSESLAKKIKYENGKLIMPASTGYLEVYAVKGDIEEDTYEEYYIGSIYQEEGSLNISNAAVKNLEELEAAIAAGVEYIHITKSIDLPTALEITSAVELYIPYDVELTVKEDTAGDGVFHVLEGGDLTIYGEGVINGVGKNKWNIVIFADGGNVTLNGGTYTNVDTEIMEGDTDSDHFDVIYAKGNSEVVINGGTFEGKTPAWILNLHDGSRETASITVYGGTFIGFNPANNEAEGVGTSFLAEGHKVSAYNGEYVVDALGEYDVAMVDGVAYTTLQEAINYAYEGATVTLLQNIDLPTAVTVSRKVTVELNGYNLTTTKDTAGDGVFHVLEGGDLTINGEGIVDGAGDNKWNIAIFADGGNVTLNGGTYTNKNLVVKEDDTDSNHFDVIYAKGNSEVVINGGTFEGKTPAWILNLHDGSRETASITVYGGTFEGFNPANNEAEGVGTSFLADGYEVIESDGNYIVTVAE